MSQKKQLFDIFEEEKEEIESLKQKIVALSKKHDIDDTDLFYLIKKTPAVRSVPIEVFSTDISPLESVVSYLKEKDNLSLTKIADLLARDERTIWTTYNNFKKREVFEEKKSELLNIQNESKIKIPLKFLKNRKLSILEILAFYLKEKKEMKFKQIAAILNKKVPTVTTSFYRARDKLKMEGMYR